MLPDFPELKRTVLEQASAVIRKLIETRHPILADIKTFTQHEGRALRFEQIGYGEKRQEIETHSIPMEVKFEEVPTLTGPALISKLEKLADGAAERQIKSLIARHEEAAEMTGNRIDAGGRVMDGAMLLDLLSGLQADFDSDGNILASNRLLTHPDMMATYRAAIEEIQHDTALKSRHDQAIREQFQQWVDRENRRNWLTSASERSFQIPFCQLLSTQGEQLLYIATHGPFEKGKDVITRAPSGRLRGYQLKGGDIKSAEWREIKGQINNLVEMPIKLPSIQGNEWHEPFLVTNGRIEDTVLDYINTENEGWRMRQFPFPLRTLEKSALVHQFTEVHGSFLPKESRDFRAMLSLVLRDGRAPLAKAQFSAFLETTLELYNEKLQKRDISSAQSQASCY